MESTNLIPGWTAPEPSLVIFIDTLASAVAPIPNYGLGKTINDKLKRASYNKNN